MPPGERPPRGAGGLGLGLGRLIQALAAAACFGLAGSQATTPTVTVTLPTVTPSVTASVTLSVEPNCSTWENGETWFEGSCRKHVPSGADEVYCLEKLYPLSVSHEDETTLHAVDEDHNAAPFNLLVLFGTFALGAIMRYVVMDTIIPFTVVMFLCGCLYGAIGRIAGKDSSFDKYMNLADMNPHLILYSFLPVLIFESAFAMEISVFRKVIVQCVLLAVPGLIAATAMTGYTARMMNEVIPDIHYDWSIEACFLFGTILSATDPVAVVALLKELGASQLISTMIEGESLFNDGTAIVFFNVLILAVEKESCHVTSWDTCTDQCFCPDFECTLKEGFLDVLLEFLRVSLGGLGVGLVMGMITVFSLERVFNDTLTEVTITVVSAYITFFVCEAYGKVSGVLGLVMLGCFLSYFRNCISPEVEHTLHHFWEMSAFLINSCIFALAGMIVSLRAISDVDGWDVLYLLLTYVVINVVRSLVLLMFWPILNLFEYKLTWRTFLLVAWGGLRGAVGLSLALMLNTSNDVVQPNVKEKIMFHTAGIVLLTLIINGITSRFLVSGLGLNAVELRRKLLMREKFTQLEAVSQDEINDLRKEPLYYDCNWKVTDKLVDFRSNLPDHMIDPYNSRDEDLDIKDPVELFNHNSEAARMAYLHTASSSIHKQYAQGKLSPHSVRSLGRMVQTALELTPDKRAASYANPQGFIQASYLNTELQPPPLGLRGCSYAGGKAWFAGAFEVGVGYVTMHRYSQKVIHMAAEKGASKIIIQQCKKTSSDAIAMLGELVRTDPDLANYARAVRTRHASLTVLHGMRANLKGMEHEGRIDGQDKEALKEVIKKRMKRIKRDFPKQMLLPTSTECLELASWYPGCEPEVKSCLAACVETRFIEKDVDNSFLKAVSKELGQRTDKSWCCPGLFIIVTGIVQVRLGRKMYQMGAGHTVGLHSLLTAVTEGPPTHGSERFSEVFAETDCTVGFIARHQIIALLPKYSGFFTEIWKACGASAAFFLMGMDPSHKLWKTEKLRHVSNGGYCEFILDPSRGDAWDKEKRMKIPEGSIAVVLKGTVWEFSGADMIRGPDLLPPGFKYGTFGHHAVVYFIPEEAYGNTSTRAQQRWGRLKSKVRSIGIWSGLRGPHYARCALSWAFKRSPPPDRAISPTSVPLQALLPLPMREIPLPQVLQRSQPRPVLEQQYQSQDQSQSQSQDQSHSHSHSQPPSQAGPAYNPPSAPAAQAVLPVADQQQYQQQAEQQQQQQQQQQQEQQQQQQQPTHQPTPHPLQPESRGPVPENMKSAVSAAESDWCETWNDQYKRPYFWNKVTGARQWREPAEHTEFKKSVEMRKREQDSADTSVGEHTTSEPEKPQERGLTREDMTEIVRNEIRDALETMSPTTHQQPQPQPQQQYLQHPQQQMAPREAHPSSFEYQQPSSRAESQQHVSPRVADDAPEWPGQVPAHPHHHPHQQPHAPSDYAYSEQHGSPYADPSHAQHAYSHHLPSELSAVGGGVQTYDGFSGYPGADEPASPLPHGVTYMTIPTDTGAEEQEQADDGYAHYINNGYAAQ